jgi:hypothetical protein
MSTLQGRVKEFKENFDIFEKICMDENFEDLVDELLKKQQFIKSKFLDSLTAKTILSEITFYGNKDSSKIEYDITNRDKLLLIFCLYHNWAWRKFVQLYQRYEEGGASYSQCALLLELTKLLNAEKSRPAQRRLDIQISVLETDRDRIDDLRKKKLQSFVDELDTRKALKSKIVRTREPGLADYIARYYIKSVIFESGQVFEFNYKCPDTRKNCIKPNEGANNIKPSPLREIIKTIFEIPPNRRIQMESDGMKLTYCKYNITY